MDELSTVKLSRVKQVVSQVENVACEGCKDIDGTDDVEIGMEFLISAFFPDAYDNLREKMTAEYIRGYNDGRNSLAEDDCK